MASNEDTLQLQMEMEARARQKSRTNRASKTAAGMGDLEQQTIGSHLAGSGGSPMAAGGFPLAHTSAAGVTNPQAATGAELGPEALNDPNVINDMGRATRVNFDYHIPYGFGYSKDGTTLYGDQSFKPMFKNGKLEADLGDGKPFDILPHVLRHENVEKSLIQAYKKKYQADNPDATPEEAAAGSYSYQGAHQIATGEERKSVEAAGGNFDQYQNFLLNHIKNNAAQGSGTPPSDLDPTPYHDTGHPEYAERGAGGPSGKGLLQQVEELDPLSPGYQIDRWVQKAHPYVSYFTNSVNTRIAQILGLGPDAVGSAMRDLGINIGKGGETQAMMRDIFIKHGLITPSDNSTMERIFNAVAPPMIETAATLGLASWGEAATAAGAALKRGPQLANAIFKWLTEKPMTQLTAAAGAGASAQMAKEWGFDEKYQFLASIVGGAGAASLWKILQGVGSRTIGTTIKSLITHQEANPILDTTQEDLSVLKEGITTRYKNTLQTLQSKVEQAFTNFGKFKDPDQATHEFNATIADAKDWADNEAATMLANGPDKGSPVDINALQKVARQLQYQSAKAGTSWGRVPEMTNRVLGNFADNELGLNLATKADPRNRTTLEKLLAFRQELQTEYNKLDFGLGENGVYAPTKGGQYKKLLDAVDASIYKAFPSDLNVRGALKLTNAINDIFLNGELRGFKADNIGNLALDDSVAGKLLTQAGGVAGVKALSQLDRIYMARARAAGYARPAPQLVEAYTNALTNKIQQLMGNPEDFLEKGMGGSRSGAQGFIASHQGAINAMGRAFGAVHSSFKMLGNYFQDYDKLTQSTLGRLVGKDPQQILEYIRNTGGDPEQKIMDLRKQIGGNQLAVKGLTSLLQTDFWQRTFSSTNPKVAVSKAAAELDNPQYRGMWRALMGDHDFGRFYSVVKAMKAYSDGQENAFKIFPLGFIPKSLAAMGGAAFGRSLNTGTIQVPGRMSSLFQRAAGAVIPTMMPLNRLMAEALTNPYMERWLYIHAPANPRDVMKFGGYIRNSLRLGRTAARGGAAVLGVNNPGDEPMGGQPGGVDAMMGSGMGAAATGNYGEGQ